jgi:hypothetical protein
LTRYKNWTGLPYRLVEKIKIGSTAVWLAPGAAQNLWEVLVAVQRRLIDVSPGRRSSGTKSSPRYRDAHEIWIDLKRSRNKPTRISEEAVGQIVNRVEYAAVLETADYSRKTYQTYQRVFRWARNRFSAEFDVALSFANADAFGGHRYTKAWARRVRPDYAVPVISVAPLNSLSASYKSQFHYSKRRTAGQRKNLLARKRR